MKMILPTDIHHLSVQGRRMLKFARLVKVFNCLLSAHNVLYGEALDETAYADYTDRRDAVITKVSTNGLLEISDLIPMAVAMESLFKSLSPDEIKAALLEGEE